VSAYVGAFLRLAYIGLRRWKTRLMTKLAGPRQRNVEGIFLALVQLGLVDARTTVLQPAGSALRIRVFPPAANAPEWVTLDPPDGLALMSLSCKFEYERQTREWLATYLESIDSELARLWKKLPSNLSTESATARAAPAGFVPNPVHVALYRSQLWQKTFLILDDIVQSVDERIAARMELVALDLREAILKRRAAIAQSAMEEEALCKELSLIRASRVAHL
jgi:hypothetical protein